MIVKIHIPSIILGIALGSLLLIARGVVVKDGKVFRADFIGGQGTQACRLEGFGAAESGPKGAMRWGYGPEASIQFFLPTPEMCGELILTYKLVSPIPGQDLEIVFNGKALATFSNMPASQDWSKWLGQALTLLPQPGPNTLVFRVSKWNGHESSFAAGDNRPLSLMFQELAISPK